jgi:multicomponent Na+:H+ antiporter subunit F
MFFIGVTISFCLLRGILGPRFTDRVVAVNIIGVKTILMIAALSIFLEKAYLLDICLIYSIISFLAVVVMNHTYLLRHNRKMAADKQSRGADD